MIEYNHYVRLVVDEPIESEQVREFLFAVRDTLEQASIDPKEDVVVIYNTPEEDHSIHRYDIPLDRNMSAEEGDRLARALNDQFDFDWELEASTSLDESAQYLEETVIYSE